MTDEPPIDSGMPIAPRWRSPRVVDYRTIGDLVRAAHEAHVAALGDADLCSTLVDDQDTRDTWPVSLWGGTHTATHSAPLPDDLNPEDIVGWIA